VRTHVEVCWVVAQCTAAAKCQRFRETYCLRV